MAKKRAWLGLGPLLFLAVAGLIGCQAGPKPLASLSDECAHPTHATSDWCLSIQFPNAE